MVAAGVNVVTGVQERRQLDQSETAELQQANAETWGRLPNDYQWLKNCEYD